VSSTWKLETAGAEETRALGRALGRSLQGGECLALEGELGSGKTTLVQGVLEGLGGRERAASPTYLLCHEYEARLPVLHLDAWFQERLEALLEEGLAERFRPPAVVLVEWAGRIAAWLPADRLALRLEAPAPGDRRRLRVEARGERARGWLEAWRQAWESEANPG